MPSPEELVFDPDNFKGKVRLFPLPNLVVFPHVLQPLHIFEPRYRELLEEALSDDGLIAMAVLAPGWQTDYDGRPPVQPVACLGKVATHQRLDDGKYNVLLIGVARVGLVRELPPLKSFREARVELLTDVYPTSGVSRRPELHRELLESFKRTLPKSAEGLESLEQLLASEVSLGMLTDIVAYSLDLNVEVKEQLLRLRNVDERAESLLEHLSHTGTTRTSKRSFSGPFPPEFSAN